MIAALLVAIAGAPADGATEPVQVTVVGTDDDLRRVRDVVDPRRLGGTPPRWTRAARFDPEEVLRPGTATALRCWVDLSDPRRARLTFAAPAGARFLIRDVELSGRFDEMDRESLAQVLELSVSALLEDARAGMSRAEVRAVLLPPPAAPPATRAPPVAPGPPSRLRPGVFYAATALGGGLPIAHGPGLSVDWSSPSRPLDLAAALEGQAQLPARAEGNSVGVRFLTVAARASLGLGYWFGGDTNAGGARTRQLIARVGLGMDFVRLQPERGTLDGTATLAPERWSRSLVVTGTVGFALGVGRRVGLEARVFADLLPTAVHYDLEIDGSARAVFSPWRLRPGLALACALW